MGEVDVLRKVLCSISYLCCQETSSSVHRSATRSLKHLTDTSAVQFNSIGMAAEVARSQLNGHQQEGRGQQELSMLSAEPLSRPNKCSTASSLFPSLYGVPTNRAQLRNVRQTKQYMPVIHVLSRACFRETVLHVSAPAKHQHNWLSTSQFGGYNCDLIPNSEKPAHMLSCFWESATFEDAVGTLLQHFCSLKSFINAIN